MTIYSIDFDGTIVDNRWSSIGALKPEAKKFILAIQERGDKWILNTMREGRYLDEAVEWLHAQGMHPDAINDNLEEIKEAYGNNPRKIFAHVYIDDHNAGGLRFEGPQEDQKKI